MSTKDFIVCCLGALILVSLNIHLFKYSQLLFVMNILCGLFVGFMILFSPLDESFQDRIIMFLSITGFGIVSLMIFIFVAMFSKSKN